MSVTDGFVPIDHVEASTGHTFLRWLASRGLVTIAGDDVALEERGRALMRAYLERDARQMWAEIIASAVGAAIGAAATVGGGLWLARRARDEEERTSAKLLGDALVRFIEAINPFIVLTGEEIERRKTADVKVELQQAHEQFEHVAELVEHLLERDRGFSAKALLGIFGIIGVLRRERELWEAEQRVIAHPRATREVLRVHVEKLRASATKMDHHAEEALTSIGRKRPIVGRAAAMELDDVVVSSAAAS